jgi:hypothetical protein
VAQIARAMGFSVMPSIVETFHSWLNQNDIDLAAARREFATAFTDVGNAEAALASAQTERDQLHAVLRATNRPIPAAFGKFMAPQDRAVFESEGKVTLARAICANLARTVQDLEAARDELQRLNSPEPSDAETAE